MKNKKKDMKVEDLVKKLLKLDQNKEIAFGDVDGKNLWFVCIDKEVLEETGQYFLTVEKEEN
jgi:hypothetical protein